MIKSDRHRAEETVKIDQPMTVGRVVKIRAAALFLIEDNFKTVEQNMIAQHVEHTRRIDSFFIFALTQTRPRRAGRLGEHGRHTHPLRLAVGADLVNRRPTNEVTSFAARVRSFPQSPWSPRHYTQPPRHCRRGCLAHRYGEDRAFSGATSGSMPSAVPIRSR